MREILFRGKRIFNDEWLEGALFQCDNGDTYIATTLKESPIDGNEALTACSQVFPNTVGQCTGLTDKNGKKIFEGDIILTRYIRPNFLVEYSEEETEYQANFFDGSCASLYKYFSSKESKVIGNIHDNPELLEDKP